MVTTANLSGSKIGFFILVKHQSRMELSLVVTRIICERPVSLLTRLTSKPVLVGLKSPVTNTSASG